MICPREGLIQSYIDGELDPRKVKELEAHISACENCSKEYEMLKQNNIFVSDCMEQYEKDYNENSCMEVKPYIERAAKVWDILERGVISIMKRYKKTAIATCVMLIAVMCITVQPIRAAVSDFLSVFRVENVKGITVSLDDLKKIQDQIKTHASEIDMDKLGKIKIDGGEKNWISYDTAARIKDFKVLFPSGDADKNLGISNYEPETIQFTLNISNVNDVLKSFGAEKLLPQNLDGKTFVVSFPRQVNIQYNTDGNSYSIIETKTPEILAQDDVSIDDVYNCLVELPIIPDDLQRQLKSIKDWKNTMYIPVVESKMEEIQINGCKGYAGDLTGINSNTASYKSVVIWYADGVFYGVESTADKDELVKFAESMR